jgi:colicin import membrane protein
MGELREDSILFSLNGLLERERQRVSDEADREFRRIESEQLARLERERRVWEERERRRQEEEALARCEEQRRREADAHLEALRRADVGRVRAGAEAEARIEVEAKQREHELRLEGIRERSGRRRAEQLAASFAAIAAIVVAVAAFAYIGEIRPEQERARNDYERLVLAERARSEQIQRLLDGSARRNAELAASLERTQRERAVLRAADARPRSEAKRALVPPLETKRNKAPDRAKSTTLCRDDGDPLNDCLP